MLQATRFPKIVFKMPPHPRACLDLFETTGWNAEYLVTPEELERASRSSWYVVRAYKTDRLVAFGTDSSRDRTMPPKCTYVTTPEAEKR